MNSKLEERIAALTRPINGQYPRPWLTNAADPATARVFTVGRNQRNGFPQEKVEQLVGDQKGYLDALFNRGKLSCRDLYNELIGEPSPTRRNTDRLVERLARLAVADVIETNVVCYSTPLSADLRQREHAGGRERGTELFQTILSLIEPRVLIAHGSATARDLSQLLGVRLPEPPTQYGATSRAIVGELSIWIIPSLAPPAFNRWRHWADDHLDLVAGEVADFL